MLGTQFIVSYEGLGLHKILPPRGFEPSTSPCQASAVPLGYGSPSSFSDEFGASTTGMSGEYNQSIDQSINQSIIQSINQSINQSKNHQLWSDWLWTTMLYYMKKTVNLGPNFSLCTSDYGNDYFQTICSSSLFEHAFLDGNWCLTTDA